jgi:hypothetical protein
MVATQLWVRVVAATGDHDRENYHPDPHQTMEQSVSFLYPSLIGVCNAMACWMLFSDVGNVSEHITTGQNWTLIGIIFAVVTIVVPLYMRSNSRQAAKFAETALKMSEDNNKTQLAVAEKIGKSLSSFGLQMNQELSDMSRRCDEHNNQKQQP